MSKRSPFGHDLRTALGDPFLTGHSGGEDGCFVKLRYLSVGEAMRAHDALAKFLKETAVPREAVDCGTHTYEPHKKYPQFCAVCGYPASERLMHPLPLAGCTNDLLGAGQ
ncbi:hypothetical protein [Methylobacterium sp. WL19]|uniref:hypothetical protein n=1 Tax=Methylobacterium sp. WL19 TaxID=2603896 RepID=UPI0011C851A6|nr:hypothetical protein [Methylobacterium sp. WL19]TXN22076.1 hypothetical protein FV220_22385 [Methylobacterium sp. WL19]